MTYTASSGALNSTPTSKTNLDFTEARDIEWQWHQLGRMQVCASLQTDSHASTPPLSFLQAGCPYCRPTNSVKALKATKYSVAINDKGVSTNHGVLCAGHIGGRLCNGMRTVRRQISHIRWNHRRQLLGARHVCIAAARLPCAELGSSSARHQSFRSTKYTALLVLYITLLNCTIH